MESFFQLEYFSINSNFLIREGHHIVQKLHNFGVIISILPVLELDPTPEDQVIVVIWEAIHLSHFAFEGLVHLLILRLRVFEDNEVQHLTLQKLI